MKSFNTRWPRLQTNLNPLNYELSIIFNPPSPKFKKTFYPRSRKLNKNFNPQSPGLDEIFNQNQRSSKFLYRFKSIESVQEAVRFQLQSTEAQTWSQFIPKVSKVYTQGVQEVISVSSLNPWRPRFHIGLNPWSQRIDISLTPCSPRLNISFSPRSTILGISFQTPNNISIHRFQIRCVFFFQLLCFMSFPWYFLAFATFQALEWLKWPIFLFHSITTIVLYT